MMNRNLIFITSGYVFGCTAGLSETFVGEFLSALFCSFAFVALEAYFRSSDRTEAA